MTSLRYWNGDSYGYFEIDILDLFENESQAMTKKFVKKVLRLCDWDELDRVLGETMNDLSDKLSELQTLLDILDANNATPTEKKRVNTRITRLEKAKALCEECT